MELSSGPWALSSLIGRPVRDQSGRDLGRVYEIRAHWEADGSIVLDALLSGRRGLLRRLRGPRRESAGIPLQALTDVGDDGIVVRR